MNFTLFNAFLFSVWWMNAADGDGRPIDCCITVTNIRVPVENIVKYDIQEPTRVCPLRAVRFLTKKDITICSDPESTWAKKAMETVDGRKTTKPSIKPTCFTSTTNMISTTTTTHETSGPKTETSTSTTEPPKVTRIDTLQLETEISETTTEGHPDCCLTVTNTRTDEDIVDYHIQDSSLCPIRAVRFITVENNTICSSPAEDWVQEYIQNLSRRKTSTDTLQLDGLSEEEKHTSERNDPYTNNEYFCVKKEPVQYFCIKQP